MPRALHIRFSLIALAAMAVVACTGGSAPAPTPVPPRASSPVTLLTATPLPTADRPLAGGGAALPRPTLPPVVGGSLATVGIPQVNTTPAAQAPLGPIATAAPSGAGSFALPTATGPLRPVPTVGPASVVQDGAAARPTQAPPAPLQIPTVGTAPQPTAAAKPTAGGQTIQFPGTGGGGAGGGGAGGGGGP